MVQAVNGVGMVSALTNLGLAYVPGVDPAMREPTSLTLLVNETSAPYGTKQTFAAKLTHSGDQGEQPLFGERVLFRLGPQTRLAITDQDGIAVVEFPILGLPDDPFDPNDDYELKASFPGTALYESSTAYVNYNITKQNTILDLTPNPAAASPSDDSILVAKLTDSNTDPRLLAEKTVFLILTNQASSEIYEEAVITDYAGRANLGKLPLEPGTYLVKAYFSGVVPLQDGNLTLNDDRYNPSTAEGILTLNIPPTAVDDYGEPYVLLEDTILSISAPGILGNDFDPDGYSGSLTVAWYSDPSQGVLALAADGSFEFTPPLNYSGEITFTYKASDGIQESNLATVTLEVTPVNDPPVAGDDAYTTFEDQVLSIAAPGVLSNDSDIENDSLSAEIITHPQHGIVILNPDGSFNYTPSANYYGIDSFTYAASDDELEVDTAIVTITIEPVNDAPEAEDDSYTLAEDTILDIGVPGVLSNDFDLDGDQISAILVSTTAHGSLTLYSDGSFSYTPVANFSGNDSFTYFASDGFLSSNLATVNLSVEDANDPPFCDSAYSSVNNLWPPNGAFYPVYVLGVTDPENDTVTITITSIYQDEPVGNAPDGIIYGSYAEVRAERDGNGDGRVYHITFIANDGNGGTCTGEIMVAVIPHDKSGDFDAIDGGALFDSTIAY
jgi:VCBS repeat-containing protein